jgi:hypothetical protein
LRSKAKKTSTVPYRRTARASATPATLVHFMSGPTFEYGPELRNFSGTN